MSLKTTTIKTAKTLYSSKAEQIENTFKQQEYLEKLAYEVASIMGFKDKEGNVDPKKVKKALLKEVILVAKLDKKNALEEKYSTFNSYMDLVEKDKSLKDLITSIVEVEQEIQELKDDYKVLKKEILLTEDENSELEKKGHDEKEWFGFTETVVNEKINELKIEKQEEFIKETTGEAPKPKIEKSIPEIFSKDEIKKAI